VASTLHPHQKIENLGHLLRFIPFRYQSATIDSLWHVAAPSINMQDHARPWKPYISFVQFRRRNMTIHRETIHTVSRPPSWSWSWSCPKAWTTRTTTQNHLYFDFEPLFGSSGVLTRFLGLDWYLMCFCWILGVLVGIVGEWVLGFDLELILYLIKTKKESQKPRACARTGFIYVVYKPKGRKKSFRLETH